MIGTLIDSVSEIVAERIYEKLKEKLQQSQRIQKVSQSSALVSSGDDDDQIYAATRLLYSKAPSLKNLIEKRTGIVLPVTTLK